MPVCVHLDPGKDTDGVPETEDRGVLRPGAGTIDLALQT